MTIMPSFRRQALAARGAGLAALALTVSACSSDGTTNADKVAEFAAITDWLEDKFNTAFLEEGAIPSTGTASFTGYAGVIVGSGAEPLALLGDASIDIDWDDDTVTGTLDDFFGVEGGAEGDYTGSVAIVNGDFLGNQPNAFTFDYAGTLGGQGNTIVLDGSGEGILKGTPIAGLFAASNAGETDLLNGVETDVLLAIAAEID
ncbi:MAG: hypothetical protein HKN63_09975 [Rhodobacteraceae bacterium]|nr:hypothetical protein [Paracoccaceae bacterium]